METLFLYLLKASGLIALFFTAYHFLLRKETFFKSNRWFLLLGLVTSILLPLVTFKKIIWVEPTPQMPVNWVNVPQAMPISTAETFEINWWLVAAVVYLIGIFIFFFKFVFDFNGLIKALKGKTVTQQADFKYIDVSEKVSPFSYFNYIVYNSSMYSESELENILEHEKVHCEQHHSIDVIIARIYCILFWYNPFIWLYQKAMLQNLEFIADSEALKNIKDKRAYQFTLLKVTTHDNCVAITNHFYQSLIKKRIVMLNKNQSKKSNSWKYFLIFPALAAFLFYFQVKVIAQEKSSPITLATPAPADPVNIVINKNTTDAEMKQHSEMMKQKYNVKLRFSKIKRNSNGEITSIKADYKDNDGHKGAYVISGDEPIKPVSIYRKDNGSIGFGNSGKQIRILRNGDDVAAIEETEDAIPPVPPVPPVDAVEPVAAEDPEDVMAFSFDMPDMPDMDEIGKDVVVKTIKGKNGKVTVIVNGEKIDVDPDKILADIDIEKIQNDARKQVIIAKKQMEAARPQMERARKRAAEARVESDDARQEMEQAREAMEQSREQLEESRKQLEESRQQLEESRKDFERQKAEFKKSKNNK